MIDVCLVVEGSYPYVTGGVSAWADGLLRGLPEVSFTVAHVGHGWAQEQPERYVLPDNARLVHLALDPDTAVPPRGAEDALPSARVYHAACTGAAGELARRAAAREEGGFALTEHGMAWREARWGIQACKPGIRGLGDERPMSPAERARRADEVLAMAMRAYGTAGAVTSVCSPNARAQRTMGATGARVIPNPVGPAPARDRDADGYLVGFVGRIVAVKDVATFLRACALVAEQRADARFVVAGPLDHEPSYAQACVELAARLGLGERIEFTGATDPAPWMARMDALALTSLSEAQPLVALEAMAAGVPVVATDVGGCREAIGEAGLFTRPGDPAGTAAALLRLAGDDLLRARLGAAGRRRTSATHDPGRVHGAYREMYERLAA